MEILLEKQNKFPWLGADWLEQEEDRMDVWSAGRGFSLPTASVRAAFPVVADILSSLATKQFSLVLPPDIGNEELGGLLAFLTSGETPSLSVEQIKKLKSLLEETCSSSVKVSTGIVKRNASNSVIMYPRVEESQSLAEVDIIDIENHSLYPLPKLERTTPVEPSAGGESSKNRTKNIVGVNVVAGLLSQPSPESPTDEILSTLDREESAVQVNDTMKSVCQRRSVRSGSSGGSRGSRQTREEVSWCEVCEHFYDEAEYKTHKSVCMEITYGDDDDEETTHEVKKILDSKTTNQGIEWFQVLWKAGDCTWEPLLHLVGASEAVEKYRKQDPSELDNELRFFNSLLRCSEPGCHNMGFKSKGGLGKHMKTKHSTKISIQTNFPLKCKIDNCTSSFRKKNFLLYHQRREHHGLWYTCLQCNFMSANITEALGHAKKLSHSIEEVKDRLWID